MAGASKPHNGPHPTFSVKAWELLVPEWGVVVSRWKRPGDTAPIWVARALDTIAGARSANKALAEVVEAEGLEVEVPLGPPTHGGLRDRRKVFALRGGFPVFAVRMARGSVVEPCHVVFTRVEEVFWATHAPWVLVEFHPV
jgi:hypothetical protein